MATPNPTTASVLAELIALAHTAAGYFNDLAGRCACATECKRCRSFNERCADAGNAAERGRKLLAEILAAEAAAKAAPRG